MWKPLNNPKQGLLHLLDELVCKAQAQNPNLIPDFAYSKQLLIASDYSGQHSQSRFESYSFVITSAQAWSLWEAQRESFRTKFCLGNRRMSYKKLNDSFREDALPTFLGAAGNLDALSFTVLVDKSIQSLFSDQGPLDLSSPDLTSYSHWKLVSFERLLRVVSFISFLLAGISSEGQDIIWFTDEDEIAPNPERLHELVTILSSRRRNTLSHNLGHIRCGTSASDSGNLQIEDLTSIPDLVAGALSEFFSEYSLAGISLNQVIVPTPPNLPYKAQAIMNWFSDSRLPFRRFVVVIEPMQKSTELTLKHIVFHGTSGTV